MILGSTAQGIPQTAFGTIAFETSDLKNDIFFNLNTFWNTTGGEEVGSDTQAVGGFGHWIITPATAVPEPSSLMMGVTAAGLLGGLAAYRRRSKKA